MGDILDEKHNRKTYSISLDPATYEGFQKACKGTPYSKVIEFLMKKFVDSPELFSEKGKEAYPLTTKGEDELETNIKIILDPRRKEITLSFAD